MAFYAPIVMPMLSNWLDMVSFKPVNKDEKLGYIDPKVRGTTFRLVSAAEDALQLKSVRTPWDCFSLADCMGKGRGKLTVRIQINQKTWESLDSLDKIFANFLVENRLKLFSASDASFIGQDNSAIRLKMKGLAPRNADGTPQTDGYITVRINGRCAEIQSISTKDGPTGRYVSEVQWAPRTTALPTNATRISIVTGISEENKPIIRDTLPIEGPVPVGSQRVRYVGPGDISTKNAVARYATLRPAYWSIAPGGGASISLVLDSLVVQNLDDAEGGEVAVVSHSVPEGFEAYEEPAAGSAPGDKRRRTDAAAAAGAAPALAPAAVERAAFQSPVASSSSSSNALVPVAPRRAAVGGGGGGGVAQSFMRLEQEAVEMRLMREHEAMRRSSAISQQFTQPTEPYELPDEEDD
jgi:hypothetical protein